MWSEILVYGSFIKNAFLKMLAYRLRYYTGIFTYLFFVAVYYFIWKAVYSGKPPDATINGFTLNEMLTYITVGWIARSSYFSNIDDDIDDLVRTGQISIYLIKPVNFQLMMFAQALGESLFRILFFTVPVGLVVLWAFPVNPPKDSLALLLFGFSSLLGFLIMCALNFLIGLLAFYLNSIDGILRAKYNLMNFASGLLLPLTFLPAWLSHALELLPFKAIAYVPLKFYLGKIPNSEIATVLGEECLWLTALVAAGAWCWSRAAAKLTLQGG